jgi:hypothetical protein
MPQLLILIWGITDPTKVAKELTEEDSFLWEGGRERERERLCACARMCETVKEHVLFWKKKLYDVTTNGQTKSYSLCGASVHHPSTVTLRKNFDIWTYKTFTVSCVHLTSWVLLLSDSIFFVRNWGWIWWRLTSYQSPMPKSCWNVF